MWTPWEDQGLEHLRLAWQPEGVLADGLIIRAQDGAAFRAHYRILCDTRWRVRQARVSTLGGDAKSRSLTSDGEGRWTTGAGEHLGQLDGCLDVDISPTPFTNTLPIRRAGMREGESAEVVVVYIALPEIELRAARQRYTCLKRVRKGARYRYESLSSGFTADLVVDCDGLVVDYPGIFRRVWPP
ncbi:MAG TPA: putative glycolipid-binding domain-containing protein [Pyrinomonadaceae bacterium]|jgi:hypothetical protein|nr:putative glycolipid-binding domain-containing protein [Pyrinomonadaceae bacterium]